MLFRLTNDQRGFTIIELVVGIGIFTLLIGGTVALFLFSNRARGEVFDQLLAQGELRRALSGLSQELRGARASSLGSYPLEIVGDTELAFYSNVDSDALVERLRYFLDGATFKRGLTKPSGTPLAYVTSTETAVPVATNVMVTTTPLFRYYQSVGGTTSTPLNQPVKRTDVRVVEINITIDKDPSRPPAPVGVLSKVQLRNIKN